jgi:hypothetical protein
MRRNEGGHNMNFRVIVDANVLLLKKITAHSLPSMQLF